MGQETKKESQQEVEDLLWLAFEPALTVFLVENCLRF